MMLIIDITGRVKQLETTLHQCIDAVHCLSAVMRVWSVMDWVLSDVNDDDDDSFENHYR